MATYAAKGFRTLTGYPVSLDAGALIEFLKTTFGAEEVFRTIGSAGGVHAELRIGDSMLMIGGGGPDLTWSGDAGPMAFHVLVPDTDAAYEKAIGAGADTLQPPADQFWGERTANIRDPFGNHWYIGTVKGKNWFYEAFPMLQPYLHPVDPAPLIDFLHRVFGAQEQGRFSSPEGKLIHTTLKFGDDATLELTEAGGPYQPMPGTFYLYVPDVDETYRLALEAGSTSISRPVDQSYGDRSAGVTDPFGNTWYIATHLLTTQPGELAA